MLITIAIDGVLFEKTDDASYQTCIPIESNIHLMNDLHLRGHKIIVCSSRGLGTDKIDDLLNMTAGQLKNCNIRYTTLKLDKLREDCYVDDVKISIDALRAVVTGCNMSPIDLNYAYWLENSEMLSKHYLGKHIVIYKQKVVAICVNSLDAHIYGEQNFKPGSFIVQHILPLKELVENVY